MRLPQTLLCAFEVHKGRVLAHWDNLNIRRVQLRYGPAAPPALRALAEDRWIPSVRSELQQAMLRALGLNERPELGTTFAIAAKPSPLGKRARSDENPGNSR